MENKKGHKTIIGNKAGLKVVRICRRKAIRYFCAECVGWGTPEIDRCNGRHLDGSMCSFHSFRSGKGKQNVKKRDAAIKNQCRYCMRGNFISISRCTSRYCPIYPYRNHRTDRTYFYPASWHDDEILKSGLQN
jgi:hypothetical protein